VTGELEIRTIPGKEEYSSLGVMKHPSIAQNDFTSYQVPSERLDHLVEQYGLVPGFIKIDVEGVEHLVLEGAKITLEKYRPVILSEVSELLLSNNGSSAKQVIDFIKSYNYQIIDPLAPDKELSHQHCGDILCIPIR